MKKKYVLDTSVLIHDPLVLEKFDDNELVLPITVIEKLDHLKRGQGEAPHSAVRHSSSLTHILSAQAPGAMAALPGGGSLRVELLEKMHNRGATGSLRLTFVFPLVSHVGLVNLDSAR